MILLIPFNLPYKMFIHSENTLFLALDAMNNSLTESMMLFLHLAITESLSKKSQISPKSFYYPKIAICGLCFLAMWAWQFADQLDYVRMFHNDFKFDKHYTAIERVCLTVFLICMTLYTIYDILLLRIFFKRIVQGLYNNGPPLNTQGSFLILFLSHFIVILLAFPFES